MRYVLSLLCLLATSAGATPTGACPEQLPDGAQLVTYTDVNGVVHDAFATDLVAAIVAVEVANQSGGNQCYAAGETGFVFYTLPAQV